MDTTIYTDANFSVKVSATAPRLKVVTKPLGALNRYPASGDFTWVRPIANIALEAVDRPGVSLANLNQTVTFVVNYTKADRDQAAAARKSLALGYWNGSSWVRFSNFQDHPNPDPAKGGYGTVSFSNWVADPPVGWGV